MGKRMNAVLFNGELLSDVNCSQIKMLGPGQLEEANAQLIYLHKADLLGLTTPPFCAGCQQTPCSWDRHLVYQSKARAKCLANRIAKATKSKKLASRLGSRPGNVVVRYSSSISYRMPIPEVTRGGSLSICGSRKLCPYVEHGVWGGMGVYPYGDRSSLKGC